MTSLYVSTEEFKKKAKPVKRGDLIGFSGLRSGYDETPANPTEVDPKKNLTWDPHGAEVHWELYTRTADGWTKLKRYYPFDI